MKVKGTPHTFVICSINARIRRQSKKRNGENMQRNS